MAAPNDPWIVAISALLTGGGAKFIYDTVKDYRSQPSAAARQVATVDASIITVSRARDELAEDLDRMRAVRIEDEARWQAERDRYEKDKVSWQTERAELRQEITRLETAIRQERDAANERYNQLLARLADIAQRHTGTEGQA